MVSKPVSGQRPLTGPMGNAQIRNDECAYGINLEVYIEFVNFACQRAMAALAIELTLWEFALTIAMPLRS
ncbi:MAG: hypothetical protein WAM79_18685 [Candidatus Sulfotelmatobacter sp.]